MVRHLTALIAVAVVAGAVAAAAAGAGGPGGTLAQAQAAGWDCNPPVLIFGYRHCAPPGKPSVADLIAGTNVPSLVLRVFSPDGTFAGTELLLRADLYAGQGCPQDSLSVWDGPLFGYFACHRFDT
jgi:hypothetical protein